MLSQLVMRADLSERLTQRALYAAGAAYEGRNAIFPAGEKR